MNAILEKTMLGKRPAQTDLPAEAQPEKRKKLSHHASFSSFK